jgi:hypothetical protein
MKKLLSFACAIAVGVALSSSAFADITDNTGAGFVFPDNDPNGFSTDIVIGANETISDVSITLFGAGHTWIGDLVVTVSNGSTSADLMFRPGQVGGVGAGDSSNLGLPPEVSGQIPAGTDYTFADGGADLWAAVAALGGTEFLASGTYGATTVDGAPVSLAALFGGQSTAGTWTLTISDNAAGDLGAIDGWGISFVSTAAIPEPGSLALLSVLGVACVVRRRR